MENVNFNELFGNFTAADALATTESKKTTSGSRNPDIYKPSIKDEKCKDMNYRACGRFIPYFHEGKPRTIAARWECFLKDVNGDNAMFVVSPKTDNRRCPIRTLSYNLYKSESAIDKANSKKLQVYPQYYALFEIITDIQHPELNGKVVIFQFGQKIYDKIEAVMKSTEFEDGFNPFALYSAKVFEINLKKDPAKKMDNGSPVTNYESCRFIDRCEPIHFGEGNTLTNDRESQNAFLAWLENGAPNIKEYHWKEWDAETTEKVNNLLSTYTSGYVAPRTTVAAAKETISIATESHPENVVTSSPVVEDDTDTAVEETSYESSTDDTDVNPEDDSWINDILSK